MSNTAAVGGNVRYPSLQSIADLFRAKVNDTMNNTTGTGVGTGNNAGLVMSNQNPDLLTFMDSAITELYADLRNVGDPELILDNYILYGIPALTQQDPTIQVGLSYAGYFDGTQWWFQWKLPIGLSKMLAMWERQSSGPQFGYGGGGSGQGGYGGPPTGTGPSFQPMQAAPFGLTGGLQGLYMGFWEMREGICWMRGATQSLDLRIRCRINYPVPLYSTTLNFSTCYVPILDSKNAIVSKMMINYAQRFAPEQYPMCVQEEARQMGKLRLEVVRQMQSQENARAEWGEEATADFAISWSWI